MMLRHYPLVSLLFTAASTMFGADGVTTLSARLRDLHPTVVAVDPGLQAAVKITGAWSGDTWSGQAVNTSNDPVALREIVLYEGDHGLPAETPVYGESFQMLSQIIGTLAAPKDLGGYPDRTHYRIPEAPGYRTASGMLTLMPTTGDSLALGFTSCHRFIGRIGFQAQRLRISLDTEGLSIPPHGTWTLEPFACLQGPGRDTVLGALAKQISRNHPQKLPAAPPVGWCSWYYYYEFVTAQDVQRNMTVAKERMPALRYIQLDDGYQAKMGDWLDTGTAFGGNTQDLLAQIRHQGFLPAIWVAPFIAEKSSAIFREHPDWFVSGDDGQPLDSSTVGFGGWRCGPWYVLDGTHPAVQQHLERVFRTMREQWGVTYFKLDANYWGALHGGHHHDTTATRIEAYRRGMEAIRRGAGDAFILGCNAPMWPSLGLVDGMRTSNDISRSWENFRMTGQENLARSWQNGRLWWSDPDCLVLTNSTQRDLMGKPSKARPLTDAEFLLHATVIYATGGLILSGDDLAAIPAERLAWLQHLLTPTGRAMGFADGSFQVGRVHVTPQIEDIALFNWDDAPVTRTVAIPPGSTVRDLWTNAPHPVTTPTSLEKTLAPHSAALLRIETTP